MALFSRFLFSLFISVCFLAGPASAGESGPYVGGSLGLSIPGDMDLDGGSINSSADLDKGLAGSLSIGRGFGDNFRGELELGYRNNDADSVSGSSATGDVDAWNLMVNGLYDFDTGGPLTPYVGLGLGVARVSVNGISPVGGTRVDDSDHGLAYQGIVGAAYDLTQDWMFTADYRYLAVPDLSFGADNGTSLDSNYDSHSIMVGFRYNFPAPKMPVVAEPVAAAPEPAPEPAPVVEPAPAPEIARNYLVFFDWDKSDLLPFALDIIAQAAENARQGGITTIVATGHADRSGTDAYNMRLSQRRAEAVQAELVRLGIPVSEIKVAWKGERDPLVPTDDGVREPQNRRVEIVFP